jgi:hypothetical protein
VEWLTPQRRAISRLPKVGFLVIIFWDEESPISLQCSLSGCAWCAYSLSGWPGIKS